MSDNFTPLPSPTPKRSIPKKQIIGGILTLGLILAIGSGVFLVNNVQNKSTKAYSTDQCVSQGGFEWEANCPPNTNNVGTIESSVQGSGDQQSMGGSIGSSTGGNHVCCVPVTTVSQTKPTDLPAQTIPTTQQPTNVPEAGITKPVENPSCRLPQPQISISCPNNCAPQ